MKTRRLPFRVMIAVVLAMFLLTACRGTFVNTWPGAAANQDAVYVAFQGSIQAINAANGSTICSFPSEPDAARPFYAAPAVSEDLVVAGNYGHVVYGFNKNCVEQWSFDAGSGNFVASPLIVDDIVLAPSSNDNLYALDASTGAEIWRFQSGNMLWATPASDGEMVYLPALDHTLYALNLDDGSLIWKTDLGSALVSAPVVEEDMLYIGALSGEVLAVNTTDGSIAWRTQTNGQIWSTPVLHENVLYTGNEAGMVSAISIADGSFVWPQQNAGGPIIGGGVLIEEGILFPLENGRLVAYNFQGEPIQMWNQSINGKLYSTPVVAGQTLVVPVTEGGDKLLQAFSLNGQQSWPYALPK